MSYNEFGGTVGGPIKKNKVFYFVSYESIRDHKAVDRTVTVPLPAMLRGDLSLSPDADLRPALWKCRTARVGRSSRYSPAIRTTRCATRPPTRACLNIIPAARMDPIAQKIASYFPANNLNRERNNYFVQAPFTFDRQQVDSRFDYNATLEVQPVGHVRHAALPHERADGVRRHRRGATNRRQQQPRHTAMATRTGSR